MNKLDIINKTVGFYFSVDLTKTLSTGLVYTKLIAVKLCLSLTDSSEIEVAEFYNTTVDKMNARLHELELYNILEDGVLNKDYKRLKSYLSEILEHLTINK